MKKGIHPNSRPVVYRDTGAGVSFLTRSTAVTKDTIEWEDGNVYPLIKVEISSASHPFYTGSQKFVDTAGRVERFTRRFGWGKKKKAEEEAAAAAAAAAEAAEAEGAETEGTETEASSEE